MVNLLHVLSVYADKEKMVVNAIVEVNAGTINKYELVTETGHLKLDRVGYSSLAYPFTYGAIPKTLDFDNDPLDIIITCVTEPLIPGSWVEARVIGLMKFKDGGEVDDKIVAVLNDDKRVDHINSINDLGEYWIKETSYYWQHYKDLKKPGTCEVIGYFGIKEAEEVISSCIRRYNEESLKQFGKEKDNHDCDDCCNDD
ncbi:inorganic diphosphatase [Candidatus Dojkabacteria bacterium]|uniref:inorganic diphosphatase n=1 Tax=Candidatus Dojkabacteria bacterium TaxID=2099670 RepID=A0A3M0Z0G7_9BACT|nr:MAG: inorganic diphosphatase [Candidatus Dojkabacteria bacterium]